MDQVEAILELTLGIICRIWSLKSLYQNPLLIQTSWADLEKMRSVTETTHEQQASAKQEREGGCHSKKNTLADSRFMINEQERGKRERERDGERDRCPSYPFPWTCFERWW